MNSSFKHHLFVKGTRNAESVRLLCLFGKCYDSYNIMDTGVYVMFLRLSIPKIIPQYHHFIVMGITKQASRGFGNSIACLVCYA